MACHSIQPSGDKIHICSEFPRSFGQARHLNIVTHTKESAYNCVQCNKSYGLAPILKKHMLTHSGVKTHICSECQRSFGQSGNLRRHMITHTHERVYKCVQCSKSFGEAGGLKNHMTTHSGIKTHTCSKCKKLFGDPRNLRRHMNSEYPHWGKSTQMCRMRKFILSSWKPEKAHAHPQ